MFTQISRVFEPGGGARIGVKNSLYERLCPIDRLATVGVTDVDNDLVFTEKPE